MTNIHASAVVYKGKGLLFLGPSGSGKSDIIFRLIRQKGAILLADDRVDIESKAGKLQASAPLVLEGLLEIRGLGVKKFSFLKEHEINLVFDLCKKPERMPEEDFFTAEGLKIKKHQINPFELSVLDKIDLICDEPA